MRPDASRPFLALFLGLAFCAVPLLRADTPSQAPRPADDPYAHETKAQRDARMEWWREAKFGMFIHWGIYSVPAGVYHGEAVGGPGEWIMHDAKIPVREYARYARRFDPVQFDADAWVSLAQAAGMKYIVITAKHHDGFAMFKTGVGGFNVVQNSPFKRDPLRELAEACRRHGMKLGFYYSQNQDWHQPGGAEAGGSWDPRQKGSTDAYLKAVALPQVKELLTNYGPGIPAVLWWDTPMDQMTPARASLFQPLLKLRPGIITNNRLSSAAPPGQGYPGDTDTPEQQIPPDGYPGRDWETCMTINDTWGYKSLDTDWKSAETLLHNLIDIASKGGNYLLNVGPNSLGEIPAPEASRLRAIGAWLAKNGEAVYGTQPSPFKQAFSWGRVTQKGQRLYLSVFDWYYQDTKLLLPIRNHVTRAYLLSKPGETLGVARRSGGVEIEIPEDGDPMAEVIVVEFKGRLDTGLPFPAQAKPDHQVQDSGGSSGHGFPSPWPTQRYFDGAGASTIISVNFQGGAGSDAPEPMGPEERAGMLRVGHWNNAPGCVGKGLALLDGAGKATGASLSWNGDNTWETGIPDKPGDFRMMKGYLDTSDSSGTKIRVQGLPAAFCRRGYRVYVYFNGDAPERRTADYTLGALRRVGVDPADGVFSGRFATEWDVDACADENVVFFENQHAPAFVLTATPLDSGGATLRAPVNGFQIMAEP